MVILDYENMRYNVLGNALEKGYNDKLIDVNLRWWPKYQPLEQCGIASLNSLPPIVFYRSQARAVNIFFIVFHCTFLILLKN